MNSAIRPSLNLPQVYLYLKPVDFRKSFSGLRVLILWVAYTIIYIYKLLFYGWPIIYIWVAYNIYNSLQILQHLWYTLFFGQPLG